ncbi:autophagy-related protein 11-domain-containing protein [Boeremia exigua]|uniref:autophagy-related protein 11-domain-containing protein n=1 Tax=Boeremia exigua TaxID=749465 RepID=UPI001E8DEA3C|nr:autophagy-related protein 11-domain-containing protein [Boeremia exigua]KAH6616309.1 autophagy-related protein 11-domain-containing protein [Boeremia exigua]
MSLQIAVAHTGQRFDADPVAFGSVDALKHWIARATEIPPELQILLTPAGKHVKLQALLTEKDIFVYSRELSNGSQRTIPSIPLPDAFTPEDPPKFLANNTDMQSWRSLFQARRDWAFAVLESSHAMSLTASKHFSEQATIERGTQVAVGNHDSHIKGLEQKYQAAKEWFDGVEKEASDNLRRLDADFGQLGSIPAKLEFARFLTKELRSPQAAQMLRKTVPTPNASLQDFLDVEAVKKATGTSKRVRESFGKRMAGMNAQLEQIAADYNELLSAVGQSQSRSLVDDSEEPARLYNEIDAVAKKVESDYEHVMGLSSDPKSVAQVSKMALLHTRNFLPAISEYSVEMSDLVRRSVEQKNTAIRSSVESMQGIANIESVISGMNAELETIDIPQEGVAAFELISLVGRLPYIYGTLLVEAVRRREWTERVEKDTSSLAEEMATFQEEEERRRKRWLKPIADVINVEAVQGGAVGFEMNVQPEKHVWPEVARNDLKQYLQILQNLEGQSSEADALTQAIKDLDRPTKQQIKRAKNFKMGSVHEPAFGKGSQLMVRGDDELRVLREANAKLDDELKANKSRVRRLEDLLHRSNQNSRLSIGGAGAPPPGFQSPGDPSTPIIETASPKPYDELSRRSSISSRRLSAQGDVDKRRITRLEQQLSTEKDARNKLDREAKEAEAEMRRQIEEAVSAKEEAVSTKENIMENMKAQQKEFGDERRSLEEEIHVYKAKIEEAEDELDRILGSRDNARSEIDARVHELTAEYEKIRTEAAEQLMHANEQITDLRTKLADQETVHTEQVQSLKTVFGHLAPNSDMPDNHLTLLTHIEDLASRSFNHQRELEEAVAIAKSENENTCMRVQEQEQALAAQINKHEQELAFAREQLDTEKARAASIAAELDEERGHLHDLRAKFAEGETGSEALRRRAEEEEAKVGRLQIELAEQNSHSNSLDVEIMRLSKKVLKYEEFDSSRSQLRLSRAKELSQRLYVQHERLVRLLEALGFIITHENGEMVLQRASKMSNSSVMAGTTGDLGRSTTAASPTPLRRFLEDNGDLSFLQWTDSTSVEEEDERYKELISKLELFNTETFGEAVAKRMRDMEHTARKWQKEARAYRDKSHRFQADSHEKIAYRSFKEGDLALFLPTRNNAHRPWAAFNVGAPHFFLREQDSHRLHGKEWLVARISKIEERVVDLSKTLDGPRASLDGRSIASSNAVSVDDDNPFELSDGLRWYLLDATEEKPMAPGTPGLKSATTATSSLVTGQADMQRTKKKSSTDPAIQLGKSLDSRRSSGTSKKSIPVGGGRPSVERLSSSDAIESGANSNTATRGASPAAIHRPSHLRETSTNTTGADAEQNGANVRQDQLWGP